MPALPTILAPPQRGLAGFYLEAMTEPPDGKASMSASAAAAFEARVAGADADGGRVEALPTSAPGFDASGVGSGDNRDDGVPVAASASWTEEIWEPDPPHVAWGRRLGRRPDQCARYVGPPTAVDVGSGGAGIDDDDDDGDAGDGGGGGSGGQAPPGARSLWPAGAGATPPPPPMPCSRCGGPRADEVSSSTSTFAPSRFPSPLSPFPPLPTPRPNRALTLPPSPL